jgi:hypothetical protein
MRKLLFLAVLAIASSFTTRAQTIAKWTFETSQPTTAGPFAPEIGGGGATGSHAGAAVYSHPSGNGSTNSFSSTLWAVGDYYQFQTSTLGFTGISLSYDQTSSNTGPKDYNLQYSTDNILYTTFASYSVLANAAPNNTWSPGTVHPEFSFFYDLSSVPALDNQATVYFRLVQADTTSANGGTVGTGGTDRVDNFTVAVVPEPGSPALFAALGSLMAVSIRRRK